MFCFRFDEFPSGVAKLVRGDAHDYSWYGCGVSISPNGNHVMHINNGQHTQVVVADWNNTTGNNPLGTNPTQLWLGAMQSWRPAGTLPFCDTIAGGGSDANRWSCNDDKWICMCVGWRGRNGDGGCNQVLVNWVDQQIVRTSMDTMSPPGAANMNNEAGDFWVGNVPPVGVTTQIAPAMALPLKNNALVVYDMVGRQLYSNATHGLGWDGRTLSGVTLKRGVYLVQQGSGKNSTTQKVIIQ
jgi:hypothetical protein